MSAEKLDLVLDELTSVCEALHKLKYKALKVAIPTVIERCLSGPAIDSIALSEDSLGAVVAALSEDMEYTMSVIYNRLYSLHDVRLKNELITNLTANAGIFYVSPPAKAVEIYTKHPLLLLFRLFEQLDLPRLTRIGVVK